MSFLNLKNNKMKLEKLNIEEFNGFKLVTSNLKSVLGGKNIATGTSNCPDMIDACGMTTEADGTKKKDTISI